MVVAVEKEPDEGFLVNSYFFILERIGKEEIEGFFMVAHRVLSKIRCLWIKGSKKGGVWA